MALGCQSHTALQSRGRQRAPAIRHAGQRSGITQVQPSCPHQGQRESSSVRSCGCRGKRLPRLHEVKLQLSVGEEAGFHS